MPDQLWESMTRLLLWKSPWQNSQFIFDHLFSHLDVAILVADSTAIVSSKSVQTVTCTQVILLKCRLGLGRSEVGLRSCFSTRLPEDAPAAGPWTTL